MDGFSLGCFYLVSLLVISEISTIISKSTDIIWFEGGWVGQGGLFFWTGHDERLFLKILD